MKIKKDKIEELLIKNWTEILDFREMSNFIKNSNYNINFNKIYISRFELLEKGFLIWIEIENMITNENKTFECSLYLNGNIEILKVF